jgi:hypothetical protein
MPSHSVCKKYQHSWTEKFGLRIGSRDSKMGEIMSVCCMFCEFGGKEIDPRDEGIKRKATERIKYFGPPWRSDNFSSHLSRNHPHRYNVHKNLLHQEKKNYFKKYVSKARNIFNNPINATENGLTMLVNKDVVETLIGQLLLDEDLDDNELSNRKSALEIFHLQEIDILQGDQDENSERYLLAYKNLFQFI